MIRAPAPRLAEGQTALSAKAPYRRCASIRVRVRGRGWGYTKRRPRRGRPSCGRSLPAFARGLRLHARKVHVGADVELRSIGAAPRTVPGLLIRENGAEVLAFG